MNQVGNRSKVTIKGSRYELWIPNNDLGKIENSNDLLNYQNFISLTRKGNYLEYAIPSFNYDYLIKIKTISISDNYTSYEYHEMLRVFNSVSNFYYFTSLNISDFGDISIENNQSYSLIDFSNLIIKQKNIYNQENIACNCGKPIFQNLDFLLLNKKYNIYCNRCKGMKLENNYDYINYKKQGWCK